MKPIFPYQQNRLNAARVFAMNVVTLRNRISQLDPLEYPVVSQYEIQVCEILPLIMDFFREAQEIFKFNNCLIIQDCFSIKVSKYLVLITFKNSYLCFG